MRQGVGVDKKKKRLIIISTSMALLLGVVAALYFLVLQPIRDAGVGAGDTKAVRDTRPDDVKKATETADTQSYSGDLTGAYATLDAQIAKTSASDTDSLLSLYQTKSFIATNGGQKDVAVAAQQKAIALAPDDPSVYNALGDIYTAFNDGDNAGAAYKQAESLAAKSGARPSPDDASN